VIIRDDAPPPQGLTEEPQPTGAKRPATLEARDLTLAYDRRPVVENLSVDIIDGRITTIIGANGCGKSTLLRGFARLLKPASGAALLDGQEIHRLPTKEVARRIGLLPQSPITPDGIVVEDLVSRGRYPHQSFLQQWSRDDQRHVNEALDAAGVADLRLRVVDELSGGERQRVWIALALAQDTEIMLLDEPTTFLDIAHQVEVLDLLAELNRTGITVVLVLHDINQACRYADTIIAMRQGQIWEAGAPHEVITEATVEAVYGLKARVIEDPINGTPLCIPLSIRSPNAIEVTEE
jgi:iron complex transport system ATP-binding protein